MDIKRFSPWNWLQGEKHPQRRHPARTAQERNTAVNPIFQLHNEIERLFDNAFRSFPGAFSSGWEGLEGATMELMPSLDIRDTEDHYLISVEIPGVARDDVDITVEDNTLIIRGEKKQEHREEQERYHWLERLYGAFERVLTLPHDAIADSIDARFRDGVLTIAIKRQAVSAPQEARKIEVKAA